MAVNSCNITLPDATVLDGTIAVQEKITTLTNQLLDTDSVYMRAKDTFRELMDGRKISEEEYAQLASQFVSALAVQTTQTVMSGALQWAEREKTLGYELAKEKANIEVLNAQRIKIGEDICTASKETELKCAQITATIAGSIRDNGSVTAYDVDNPCVPTVLADEGTKYEQALFIQSQKYANLADAFRKSGVVQITSDLDGILKGTSGDAAGYTDAQEDFARRQVKSFEDSKRNHAVNAISQLVGQLLSQDEVPSVDVLNRLNTGLDYLLTNTP